MLWYKSWLETRWRFIAGFAILMLSASGTVLFYPQVAALLASASGVSTGGELGRQIREGLEVSRSFRGYVWWQSFHQNLPQMGTLFAALLGTGGLLQQSTGGAALFTLSLPVSRRRNLGVRAATGLAEWAVIALVPS